MMLAMRLWMAYIEKHPNEVPAEKMSSVYNVLELIETDSNQLSTKDIALAYQSFVETFSQDPKTLENILKVPILFLIPEINS
jgi:hypothetical protein